VSGLGPPFVAAYEGTSFPRGYGPRMTTERCERLPIVEQRLLNKRGVVGRVACRVQAR
jgi:hypothetical protein